MQKIANRITLLCLIIMAIEPISVTGIGIILPAINEEFQLSSTLLGVVGGAMPIGMLFTFAVGKLSDKIRRILVIQMGNLIVSLSTFFIYFTQDLPLLIIFLALGGVGISFLESSINPLMAEIHFRKERKMINVLHAVWSIGATLGPIIATYVLSLGLNWRILYLIYSMMHLVIFLVSFFFPRNSVRNARFPASTIGQKVNFKTIRFWLLIPIVLTALFISSAHAGIGTWLPSFLIFNKNFSPELAGITLSLVIIFISIGRFTHAFLADKFDSRLIILGSSLIAGLVALIALTISFPVFVIVFWCIFGFFIAPNLPTLLARVNTIFPAHRGFVTGTLFTSMAIGGFLSAWLMGLLTQLYSMYVGMLFIIVALIIIALIQIVEKVLVKSS